MTDVLFVVAGMGVALFCGHSVQRFLNADIRRFREMLRYSLPRTRICFPLCRISTSDQCFD